MKENAELGLCSNANAEKKCKYKLVNEEERKNE